MAWIANSNSKNLNINPNYCEPYEREFCNGVEILPVECCDRPKPTQYKSNCNKNINKNCCIVPETVFCNGVEIFLPLCGCTEPEEKICGKRKPIAKNLSVIKQSEKEDICKKRCKKN